ncbi:hypothetical protein Z950_4125 [Sulfitobacter mediterraneus KCTC 32188]|nr:hypothetical protein Z950_4125 [Sulfitobacter mediterraneus KCTC 32188]
MSRRRKNCIQHPNVADIVQHPPLISAVQTTLTKEGVRVF